MKSLLILLALAIITCSSCKKWQHKYLEDTERTKLTPEERLTGKTWTLTKATLNGIDYTDTVLNKIGKLEINLSTVEEDMNYNKGYAEDNVWGKFSLLWSFENNENDIKIFRRAGGSSFNELPMVMYISYLFGSGFYSNYTYNVLKLTDSEFKIQCTTVAQDSTFVNYFQVK